MAGARISVIGEDGGLGYRGPDGPMTWAAFGVCSLADAIADQEPLTITSPPTTPRNCSAPARSATCWSAG